MIFIGLGANLVHPIFGPPQETIEAAIKIMDNDPVDVVGISDFYESRPVPISDDPWYVNAAISIATSVKPFDLLQLLHKIEKDLGRVREAPNGPRVIDLDLLAYEEEIAMDTRGPILPHPRISQRAFVLQPLCDLDSQWVHPVIGKTAKEMLAEIPKEDRFLEKIIRPKTC
ncbi:MAG: 2-amino-4-hydroxy-6-hydroxymethyldihydropteridine diphosphokinase [Rhodospirillaceae bacterium]|jgi:2-amino-4-hydroxy-6-hydroxymethyldihydropteridine diphosphokinase